VSLRRPSAGALILVKTTTADTSRGVRTATTDVQATGGLWTVPRQRTMLNKRWSPPPLVGVLTLATSARTIPADIKLGAITARTNALVIVKFYWSSLFERPETPPLPHYHHHAPHPSFPYIPQKNIVRKLRQ